MFYEYATVGAETLALYQFDGDLTDSGPNGLDLSVISGYETYGEVYPGIRGIMLSNTTLGRLVHDATLALTGDISVEMLVTPSSVTTADAYYKLVGFYGNTASDVDANNSLWEMRIGAATTSSEALGLTYYSEYGTVVSGSYNKYISSYSIAPQTTAKIRMVRASDVIYFYLDDVLVEVSSPQTTPTGGASAVLKIGGEAATLSAFRGVIASLHVMSGAQFPGGVPLFISLQDPAPDEEDVAYDTDIEFRLEDPDFGVDADFDVYLRRNGGSWETVYTSEAFQAGYTGSVTPSGSPTYYDVVINPAVDFESNAVIDVRVVAVDIDPSPNTLDTTYSFTIEFIPEPPPEPTLRVKPGFDTFRGGKRVVIHSNQSLYNDATDISFEAQSLPAAWTATGSVDARLSGLSLYDNTSVACSTEYDSFAATLLWESITPKTENDDILVEFRFTEGEFSAGVGLRVYRRDYRAEAFRFGDSTVLLGSVVPTSSTPELTIVRHERFVYFQVDGETFAQHVHFPTDAGTFELRVPASDSGKAVVTRIYTLSLQSHFMIDGQLLAEKAEISEHRFSGLVPPSRTNKPEFVDATLFGPWGSVTGLGADFEGFQYIHPPVKTIGNPGAGFMYTFDDEQIKD